jgi:hypothetical protein
MELGRKNYTNIVFHIAHFLKQRPANIIEEDSLYQTKPQLQ